MPDTPAEHSADLIAVWSDILQHGYRQRRMAWAAEIGFPVPKRRRRNQHPPPGVIDAAADEAT